MRAHELKRLRELTELLPPPTVGTEFREGSGFVEYHIDGTCFGFALFYRPEVAVQRSFISAGSRFLDHVHETHEFLLVYQGQIVVYIEDEEYEVGIAGVMHIEPDTPHSVVATEDTWLIGITVPAEEGYPHK